MSTHLMLPRIFFILLSISFFTCKQKNAIPGHLQKGLINFSISESDYSLLPPEGLKEPHLPLWASNNFINKTVVHDTLLIDVNTEVMKPLSYAGGYEIADDTMFLYATNLSKSPSTLAFATLHYKIQLAGRTFKEISFKELK